MKIKLSLTFFLLSLGLTIAQSGTPIDSLKQLLQQEKKVEGKVALYNALFEAYLYTYPDSADIYRQQIKKVSLQNGYRLGEYYYHSQSGRFHFATSNLDSAHAHIQWAAKLAEAMDNKGFMADNYKKLYIINDFWKKDSLSKIYLDKALKNAKQTDDWKLLSSVYVALGNRDFQMAQYPKALSYYLKLDSIYALHQIPDKSLAAAFANIGFIYTELKDSRALPYLRKSIELYEALGHQEGIYYGEVALGTYYDIQGDCNAAVEHLLKAKEFYENYKDLNMLEQIYSRLGNCYLQIDVKEAEKYLLKNNELTKNSKKVYEKIANLISLGHLYRKKQEFQKATAHYKQSLTLIENMENHKMGRLYAMGAYKGLIEIYKESNDPKSALAYYEKKVALEDSLQKSQNRLEVEELNKKYQTEKKEQEILLLTSQSELVEQKSKNQRTIFIGSISVLGLAFITLFFLFRNKQKINQRLRQLESAKSRFFANISHEFRTPLTLISGPVAHQLSKPKLSQEDKVDLGLIQRNADRLLSLVDQLLDLSKIEAGRRSLKLTKGSLELYLNHLVEPFSYQAERKGISFKSSIAIGKDAWFDRDVIAKIVTNLLSNALKYSPKSGKVDFSATLKPNQSDVEIKVTNGNTEISEKELPMLFDRFYQNKAQNQGFGIGLSLVKELTHLSKGKVMAHKPTAETIQFVVTLSIVETAFAKEDFALGKDLQNAKTVTYDSEIKDYEEEEVVIDESLPLLLVVDDNEEIRLFIKSLLKRQYRIIDAENGEEGAQKALEVIPDLVISDVMMPVKDGIYLSDRLKNDERTSHIPIVLLTAKSGEDNELTGLKTGADAYMTKPFKEEKLKVIIEKLIASRFTIQEKFSQQVILKPREIKLTPVDAQLLERIQKILDEQLTDPNFGAQIFSEQIGLSRMHLHRKLKALTGLSTSEFIRTQRLKMAAKLLKDGDANISEIGYTVGFNQPAYFSTAFKQHFGCSPSEYSTRQLA